MSTLCVGQARKQRRVYEWMMWVGVKMNRLPEGFKVQRPKRDTKQLEEPKKETKRKRKYFIAVDGTAVKATKATCNIPSKERPTSFHLHVIALAGSAM